ncbi:MAG: hypothetical protein ACPGNT_03180, partial [Rhodospirillales bacterium]
MTVLSTETAQSYATTLLLRQIRAYNETQRASAQQSAYAGSQSTINNLNIDGRRFTNLQNDLDNTVKQLQRTLSRAETIQAKVNDQVAQVVGAGAYGDGSTYDIYRSVFNADIRAIISAAENSGAGTVNLLGEQPTSGLTYRADIRGLSKTVTDGFIGTAYYLEEADGTLWVPDHSTNILYQRTSQGAKTGTYAAITEGIRLDSVTGTSVTFTINYNTASSQQITATLNRSGLKLVDAWYYEDLAT